MFYVFISRDPPQEGGSIIALSRLTGQEEMGTSEVTQLGRGYIGNTLQNLGLKFLMSFFFLMNYFPATVMPFKYIL